MHFQFKTCFHFKIGRKEEIYVRKTGITDKIRGFNLISLKQFKSNKNWIHCSVMICRLDGQRRHAGEGAKGRREREKFSSTVGWSRKSCNIATARSSGRWAMSLASLIQSRPIHLSAFLSPCSHSPDELATIFLFLSPLLLCSHYAFVFFLLPLCFPQTALFPSISLSISPSLSVSVSVSLSLDVQICLTTAQARLQPPVGSFHISRSDANHSASKWCLSQHADSTWSSAGPD